MSVLKKLSSGSCQRETLIASGDLLPGNPFSCGRDNRPPSGKLSHREASPRDSPEEEHDEVSFRGVWWRGYREIRGSCEADVAAIVLLSLVRRS